MGSAPRRHSIAVALAGLAIGWIAGLSVSPVVSSVMAALLAIGVAAVSALAGLRANSPQPRADEENANVRPSDSNVIVDPIPVAAFTVFLALGASAGVYAKAHKLLGPRAPPLAAVVKQWTSLGKDKKDVVDELFQIWRATSRSSEDAGDYAPVLTSPPAVPTNTDNSVNNARSFCDKLPDSGQVNQLNRLITEYNISVLETVAPKLSEQDLADAARSFCGDILNLTPPRVLTVPPKG
jgi:hypothetical protein